MLTDQIQQWEQVDPNQIDQVPEEPNALERRPISFAKMPFVRALDQPSDQHHTRDDVRCVQARHCEVEAEIHWQVLNFCFWTVIVEQPTREQSFVDLVRPFKVLHKQEDERGTKS
jgi:hypothetical protein